MGIAVLCNIARSILNRCETAVLLRKDLWVFIKRQSLIWVDSRLCVSGNGWFWWEFVFERAESCYLRKWIVSDENTKFHFLRSKTFWINLKVLNSLQHFREAPKHSFVLNFLPDHIPFVLYQTMFFL